MDKKIEVEFTSYGMCIITLPDGSEATMQGEEAAEFENSLREAEENFKESEAFATYEDLEQKLLSALPERTYDLADLFLPRTQA